ncbi:MAG: hypothetical protein IT530_16110 [Burkholderiales bacterium]|nr:hypothetical protein [Burkholderiales bacterium]
MKPIDIRSLLFVSDVFGTAHEAAKQGKTQTFVFEAEGEMVRVEYEVRLARVDGKRVNLRAWKKVFEELEGAPRP